MVGPDTNHQTHQGAVSGQCHSEVNYSHTLSTCARRDRTKRAPCEKPGTELAKLAWKPRHRTGPPIAKRSSGTESGLLFLSTCSTAMSISRMSSPRSPCAVVALSTNPWGATHLHSAAISLTVSMGAAHSWTVLPLAAPTWPVTTAFILGNYASSSRAAWGSNSVQKGQRFNARSARGAVLSADTLSSVTAVELGINAVHRRGSVRCGRKLVMIVRRSL